MMLRSFNSLDVWMDLDRQTDREDGRIDAFNNQGVGVMRRARPSDAKGLFSDIEDIRSCHCSTCCRQYYDAEAGTRPASSAS
jgi:hypothetical protein